MRHDLLPHQVDSLAGAHAERTRLATFARAAQAPRTPPRPGGFAGFARAVLELGLSAVLLVLLVALFFATVPGVTP